MWEKLLLLHHSALGVPTSGTLKNRGVPSVMNIKRASKHNPNKTSYSTFKKQMIHCLFAMEESKVSFPTQPL
jgi:hypothetical protein